MADPDQDLHSDLNPTPDDRRVNDIGGDKDDSNFDMPSDIEGGETKRQMIFKETPQDDADAKLMSKINAAD